MPLPINLTPKNYGIPGTQKQYLMLMQGETPTSEPESLLGASLTGVSQEISDPVVRNQIVMIRGQIFARQVVQRVGQQNALTYTLGFGEFLYTPALQWARTNGNCPKDFYILRVCPIDSRDLIAYVLPEQKADPPVEAVDFVTNDDTEEMVTEQTTIRGVERLALWPLKSSVVNVDTDDLFGVAWATEECPGCEFQLNTDLIAVGGDGTAAGTIFTTEDRFANAATPTSNIPAGSTGSKVYSRGNVRLVGFNATTVSGGTVYSSDAGATFTVDSNLTEPVFDVGEYGGYFFAVGGASNGGVWTSKNGISWTAQAGSLTTPAVFRAFVVDKVNNVAYVAGGAELYRITFVANSVMFEDISANLPGSPSGIVSLAIGRPGHLMVGAGSGYFAESFDRGDTFEDQLTVGSAALTTIAASWNRTLVGSGTAVRERSILTGFQFDLLYTATGNVLDIAASAESTQTAAEGDADNYFVAVTADGNAIFFKPGYPNA